MLRTLLATTLLLACMGSSPALAVDPFAFTPQNDMPLNSVITSNPATISGSGLPAAISLSSCTGTLCEYRINSGAWTSAPATAVNGDTVLVRQTSSGSYDATSTATLTIGGVSASFDVKTAAPDSPKAHGLVAWWRAENNAYDAVGGTHGTVGGTTTFASGPVGLGQAFSFPNTNDGYVTVPASSTWAFGTGDFTIDLWIYGTTNDIKRPIVNNRKTPASNSMWSIEVYGVANRVEFHSGLTIYLTATNQLKSADWNHITVTRNGTLLSMYVNDVLSGSTSNSTDFSEVNDLQIGRDTMSGNDLAGHNFVGAIDDIKIFNRALSAQEILRLTYPGLVAWWRAENNALDSIGGNHGTLTGGTDYAQGIVGSAFRFDGTGTSMINVPHSSSIDITGPITMSAWINLDNLAGYSEILFKGDQNGTPGVQSYALEITPAGAVTVVLFGGTGDIFTTAPGLISAGQWYHLAATWDGSTTVQNNVKLHLNGLLVKSWTKSSALASTTQTLTIGSHKGLNNTHGLIDEVSIYNRALSTAEIASLSGQVPNPFSFSSQTGMPLSTAIVSNPVSISGLTYPATISIIGGEYESNGSGSWQSADGTVPPGATVRVRLTSSSLPATAVTATLAIGGVSAPFTVTTSPLIAGAAYAPEYSGNSVKVINTDANTVVATIPVGGNPLAVAASRDGRRVYVTNTADDSISVIDTAANSVTTTLKGGFFIGGYGGIALSPNGGKLYVSGYNHGIVYVIDTKTLSVTKSITVGSNPNGIAASPDGKFVYVSNHTASTVSAIDAVSETVVATIPIWVYPRGITFNSASSRAYVVGGMDGENRITVIDTATHSVIDSITLASGGRTWGIDIDDSGNWLAAADQSGRIFTVNTATKAVTQLTTGSQMFGVSFIPGTQKAYVAGYGSSQVYTVDAAGGTLQGSVSGSVGNPWAFGRFITAPPAGLKAWWRAEDNALDSIGGSHGALINGAAFADGRIDRAFSFDGIDDYVSIPVTAGINGNGPGAIELWFKANSTPSGAGHYGYLYAQADTSTGADIRIYLYGDGTLNFVGHNGSTYEFNLKTPFSDTGSWHHVVGIWSATDTRFYLDGVLIGTDTASNMGSFAPNEISIGSERFANSYFNGLIDEVKVYDRLLAGSEVARLSGMVPDQFTFTAQTGMPLNTAIVSNPVTISGLTYPATISISGGVYSTGCTGSYTASAGTISNGSTVCIRQTSSPNYSTTTTATLTVGGISADFSITTAAAGDPRTTGLVSWWRAEDDSADSIGGNHGTPFGGVSYAAGQAGKAFALNGSSAYIQVPDAPSFPGAAVDFTISLWANYTAVRGGDMWNLPNVFVAQDAGGGWGPNKWVFHSADGGLFLHLNGSVTANIGPAPFTPQTGRWYHLSLVKSGTAYTFYIDGIPAGTFTGPAAIPDPAAPLSIGQAEGLGFFNGRLDEVQLYSRPLTAKEIVKLNQPGLVSWWRAENDTVDAAGGNNGVWQIPAAYTAGWSGQSFSLDGSGGILVPNSPDLNPTAAITMSAWIYPTGLPNSYPTIIRKDGSGQTQYSLVLVSGSPSQVQCDINNGTVLAQGGAIQLNRWSHVACTYNGATVTVYLNGVPVASSPVISTIPTGTEPLGIGTLNGYSTRKFAGRIDEARIYHRALTNTEIAAQYGLVSWWRAENNALDSVGGNNGAVVGGVTYATGIDGGTAFSLNGSGSYISIAAPAGIPSGAAPRTIAGWINSAGPTSSTRYQTIFGYGSPGINGGSFLLEWGGEINDRRLYLTGWNNDLAGSSQLTYGQWYHVAATYDGTYVRLYVNGVEDASAARALNTVIGSNAAGIGTSPPNDGWHSYFNGRIDDLTVYDRPLSAGEVAVLSGFVPEAFTFSSLDSVAVNTVVSSQPVTISGISFAVPVSITGGEYSLGCTGTFTAAPGTISNGATVCIRLTTSGSYGTTTTATLTVGGVSAGFAAKTKNSVTGSAPGGNGSVSCTSPVDEQGQSICTVTPATGYHLAALTDNTKDVFGQVADGSYTLVNISGNHDIVATFAVNLYTVTATATGNGTITATASHPYGSSPLYTAVPDTGFHIQSVAIDGVLQYVANSQAASSHTISSIAADHTITAVFAANTVPGSALVRNGTTLMEFQTLQDAYNSAAANNIIQLKSGSFNGAVLYARQPLSVTLKGGYADFSNEGTRDLNSVISSPFIVQSGRVNINGLRIRQ